MSPSLTRSLSRLLGVAAIPLLGLGFGLGPVGASTVAETATTAVAQPVTTGGADTTIDTTQSTTTLSTTGPSTTGPSTTGQSSTGPSSTGLSSTVEGPVDESGASTPNDHEQALDRSIQILSVDETGDRIELEVAVPPSVGEVGPSVRNFAVLDAERLVDITVSQLAVPAEVILVLDTSGSMKDSAIDAAKDAARAFVTNLPADTRVGLVTFDDEAVVQRRPDADRDGVLADIDRVTAGDGDTALWSGLVTAATLVEGSEAERSSVVVLSDGEDTVSGVGQADAVDGLRAVSAVLYAIAIESPEANFAALERTVDLVGGHYLATTDLTELGPLYTDIAGRLANRYVLRFTPTAHGQRTIVVSVAVDGAAVATARTRIGGSVSPGPTDLQSSPPPDATNPGGGGPPAVLNAGGGRVLGPVAVATPGLLTGSLLLWGGVGSMFGALIIVGLSIARPAAEARLDAAVGADRLAGVNARLGQAADQLIARHDRKHRLDHRLDAADIDLRPGEFLVVWALLSGAVALTAFTVMGFVAGLVVLPLSVVVMMLVLRVRADRRRARFANQLSETLGIMASSLRAGLSLPRTIELVAAEAPSPTADEFHRIAFEVRVGRDLTTAVEQAAQRMASPDLEWLAQAIDINRELGGDLTQIIDNVATTIRERRTVARQISALSAEGRATGWLLLTMPVAMFFFSWWRTPESMSLMFQETAGRILLGIALSGMIVGHIWIRRLVKLRF